MHKSTDILIVGAGPVGSTLARLLLRDGLRVLQLVPERPAAPPPLVIAISPAAQRILELAGLWQLVPTERIGYFDHIHSWDANGAQLRFAATGWEALACTVELELLQADDTAASRLSGAPVGTPRVRERRIHWELADGTTLDAALLVAADGMDSQVRTACGITTRRFDYQQNAMVCTARTAQPHRHIAVQAFLPEGPVAALRWPPPTPSQSSGPPPGIMPGRWHNCQRMPSINAWRPRSAPDSARCTAAPARSFHSTANAVPDIALGASHWSGTPHK